MDAKEKASLLKHIHMLEKRNKLMTDDRKVSLKKVAENRIAECKNFNSTSVSPVYVVMSTAFVINSNENIYGKRRERFVKEFSDISSLKQLQEIMTNMSPNEFLKKYMDINGTTGELNPKYRLAQNLCNGFLEYKDKVKAKTEIDAIIQWANEVDASESKIKSDFIGSRWGIGKGVVRNIQLILCLNVLKPDRRVMKELKAGGMNIKPNKVDSIPSDLNMQPMYLDTLFYENKNAVD